MKLHMNEALIRRIRRSKANGDKYTDVNNNVVCALVVYTVYCHDLEAFVLCTPRYHSRLVNQISPQCPTANHQSSSKHVHDILAGYYRSGGVTTG